MADITEKYKGHTEGQWSINSKLELMSEKITKKGNKDVTFIAALYGHAKSKAFQANSQLIADAPMLLSQLNEAVELMREVIQLGHSNSDKICKCPDCKNAIKIKKFLNAIKEGK